MTSTTTTRPKTDGYTPVHEQQRSRWSGWIVFAAVIMVIGGGLQATYGLIAAINEDWVVWSNSASIYLDLTAWGWTHIILGTVVFFSGLGLLTGNVVARAVGVVVASVSLFSNFLFIPAYPIWAITVIVLDVLVIWALIVHGSEMRSA
jgi:hypothetical protein